MKFIRFAYAFSLLIAFSNILFSAQQVGVFPCSRESAIALLDSPAVNVVDKEIIRAQLDLVTENRPICMRHPEWFAPYEDKDATLTNAMQVLARLREIAQKHHEYVSQHHLSGQHFEMIYAAAMKDFARCVDHFQRRGRYAIEYEQLWQFAWLKQDYASLDFVHLLYNQMEADAFISKMRRVVQDCLY